MYLNFMTDGSESYLTNTHKMAFSVAIHPVLMPHNRVFSTPVFHLRNRCAMFWPGLSGLICSRTPGTCFYCGNSVTMVLLRKVTVNPPYPPQKNRKKPPENSHLINWLYFAKRSDLQGAPVLIWETGEKNGHETNDYHKNHFFVVVQVLVVY